MLYISLKKIYSHEHTDRLRIIIAKLRKNGQKVNGKKCIFGSCKLLN